MRVWRIVVVAATALMFWVPPSFAQTTGEPKPAANAIDRWMTEPVVIRLSPDQQRRIDSLKVKFRAASDSVSDVGRQTRNPMAAVSGTLNLTSRYQTLVRNLLTAEQQQQFDKNARAWWDRGRGGL